MRGCSVQEETTLGESLDGPRGAKRSGSGTATSHFETSGLGGNGAGVGPRRSRGFLPAEAPGQDLL